MELRGALRLGRCTQSGANGLGDLFVVGVLAFRLEYAAAASVT